MSEPDSDPPSTPEHTGGWPVYKRQVLGDLRRNEATGAEILRRLAHIETAIATLNVKAGAWGAIAGVVTILAALLAKSLLK